MKKKNNILIIGGGGYCGTEITEKLSKNKNNFITIIDNFWYGNFIRKKANIKIVKADIRNLKKISKFFINQNILLHLACVSNDSSYELNPKLSKTINFDSFEPIVKLAKIKGIDRFIYASSSSVYGVSKKKNVTENHPLKPLTDYSKYKVKCEKILMKYKSDNFAVVIFRPATVCGYSKRQRLDLSVNILTNFAYHKNYIKIFGGTQLRPNLHIKDYIRLCEILINIEKKKINGKIFNVGSQNKTIKEIAINVQKIINRIFKNKIDLRYFKTNDLRSYHINSDKIKKELKFTTKYTIDDAIFDLISAFKKKKLINTFSNKNYFNVQKMKQLKIPLKI